MTIILGWYPETNTDDACSVKQLPGVNQPSSLTSPSQSHLFNPVKVEERTPPPVSAPEPDEVPKTEETYGWKHPAELQYYTPENWSQTKIILHLIANSFSIPPRPPARSNTPFFIVTGANGQTTRLPIGYCIPLMFIARFQWLSLELVLTASSRETEWEEYKFSILHLSRLCSTLLKPAQDVRSGEPRRAIERHGPKMEVSYVRPSPDEISPEMATPQLHLSHVDMMNMFGDNGLGGVDVAQMFTPEFIRAQ
ncbi:hypothetical protein C8R42DRAFT_729464 [Lentinula raphanica]|nr:hypothetical protein C8R42DRAFT_729464 [Lentinula raphanica]